MTINRKAAWLLAAISAMTLITLGAVVLWPTRALPPPDFSAYEAGPERKGVFFAFLRPLIEIENAAITTERSELLTLQRKRALSRGDRRHLHALAEKYAVETDGDDEQAIIETLLLRVDTIPLALALAQAAKESGWGTSRFAATGNNYFGERCFVAGCGIVPGNRVPGLRHEVTRFPNPRASVASYLRNLNSHREYQALRNYRAAQRSAGTTPSSVEMATWLNSYSERREDYIEEIQSLIRYNHLE